MEIITCDPSIYAMDHPELTVSNLMGNSIGPQRVKMNMMRKCASTNSVNAVFHFFLFSASKLCDVRVWYLNMISDGVFNIEMNGDQLDLKNSIDNLAKKATENENARKVDCYILNMYDDMLQERFSYSSRSAKIDKVAIHTDDDKDSNKHESLDNLKNKPDTEHTSPTNTKSSDEGMITTNKITNEDQPSKAVDIHENSGSVKNVDLKSDTDENEVAFHQTEGSSSEDITDDKKVESSIDTYADKHTELTKEQEKLDISELDKSATKDTKFDSEIFSDGSEINYDETDIHIDETETTEEHSNTDQADDTVKPNQDDVVQNDKNIIEKENKHLSKEQEISNYANKECNESKKTQFESETSNKNLTVKRTEFTPMPYGVCAHACCLKLDVFDNFASRLFLDDINVYESPQDKVLTGIKAPFGVSMKMESLKSDIFSVNLLYHSNNTGDNQTMESKAKRKAFNATGHTFNATEQSTSCTLGNYCDKRCFLVYSIAYCTLGNNYQQSVTESRENLGIAENKNNEMNVQDKPDHIASPEETLDSIDESIHISNNNVELINKENIINSAKFPYERLEQIVNQSTGKCNEKIQMLELMITKLENQVLVEKLNKQNHSSTITRLENMILKLENDLLRMYRNYETLRDDFSQVNNKQNTYLKIAERQEQQMKKYPELPNKKLENLELISKHQERISELSQFINNHSDTLNKMQSRAEYLEEQNRILQQMIMNQSNFMATLMQNVQHISEQNLKQTLEMNEIKQKVSNIQASDSNLYMQSSAFLSKLESLASVEKIKLDKIEVETENMNKKHIHKMSEDTGNIDNKFSKKPKFSDNFAIHWCSFNSINIDPCLYQSVMHLKNCIPYKNVFWSNCSRNLTVRNVTEKGEKEDNPPLPMISSNISDQSIIKDTLEEKQNVNLHFKSGNAHKSNIPTVKINKALDTLQVNSDIEKVTDKTRNSISDDNNILDTTQSVLADNKDEDNHQAILPNIRSHRDLTSDKTIFEAQIVAREKTDQHETTDSSHRKVNPSPDHKNEYKTQDKLVIDSNGSKIEIPKVSDKSDDSSTLSKKEAVKKDHEKKTVKDEHEKESVKEHEKEAVKEEQDQEAVKEHQKEPVKEEREKESVKEPEEEAVKEHKKEAIKEEREKKTVKEHEKEPVQEQVKEAVKEEHKKEAVKEEHEIETVKEQEKEAVKEQETEAVKEQEKEIVKDDHEKEALNDEHVKEEKEQEEKAAVKEQEKKVVKEDQEKKVEHEKEAVKDQEKEAVNEQEKESVNEQEKEVVKEQEKEAVKEQEKEAVKEHEKEAVKEHEKEAVKEQEKEAVNEQEKEAVKEEREKEVVKEQEKEVVKEQEKEAVIEQEKEAVKEQEKEAVKEQEKEAAKEHEKKAVKEQKKKPVKEQEKEAVKEQAKEGVKEQENEPVKENDKEAVKEQEIEAVKEQEKEAVKEQEKEAVNEEQEKKAVKEQEKEAVKEQEKEAVKEQEKEAVNEQEKEAVKEHEKEAVKEQGKEAVNKQEKEAVKEEREKEVVKEQEKEAVKEHEKEAVKEHVKEAVKEQKKEAVNEQEKEAVKEEREKEVVKEQEKEVVKEQEKEAVKEQEKEAAKEHEKKAVKEQKKEAVKEQEKEAVKEQAKEGVKEQENEPVKENDKEAVKEQEKEAVKEQEREAVKEQEKEAVKEEQEKEAVKEQEKEAVKEQEKEAVKEQEKEAVKEQEKEL